jgi:VanZ family protein
MHPTLSLLILDVRLNQRRYQAALLIFALILVAGSIPGARAEIGRFATGLVLHSVAYAAITFLLYTGSAGTRGYRALRSVLTVVAMGAADETLQSMLPYRGGALMDWLVDCSAAVVCAGLLARFLPDPVGQAQA